jgi:hypothetical protein
VDGWTAAHEKATREYLTWSTTHTVADDTLKSEIQMARRAFALQEAAWAKAMVVPTPQFTDLTSAQDTWGKGSHYHTGTLPYP